MADEYYHDDGSISGVIGQLRSDLEHYSSEVNNLKNLINNMSSSSSWRDESVKTSFINKAESYILVYENCIKALEAYIRYLDSKNNSASGLEKAFS